MLQFIFLIQQTKIAKIHSHDSEELRYNTVSNGMVKSDNFTYKVITFITVPHKDWLYFWSRQSVFLVFSMIKAVSNNLGIIPRFICTTSIIGS